MNRKPAGSKPNPYVVSRIVGGTFGVSFSDTNAGFVTSFLNANETGITSKKYSYVTPFAVPITRPMRKLPIINFRPLVSYSFFPLKNIGCVGAKPSSTPNSIAPRFNFQLSGSSASSSLTFPTSGVGDAKGVGNGVGDGLAAGVAVGAGNIEVVTFGC